MTKCPSLKHLELGRSISLADEDIMEIEDNEEDDEIEKNLEENEYQESQKDGNLTKKGKVRLLNLKNPIFPFFRLL